MTDDRPSGCDLAVRLATNLVLVAFCAYLVMLAAPAWGVDVGFAQASLTALAGFVVLRVAGIAVRGPRASTGR